MSDGKSVMSAALVLAHEMGHGAQHLDGEMDAWIEGKEVYSEYMKIEKANLKKYETPIAQQLGEPTRRTYGSHKGMIGMNNSIHYRTTYWSDFRSYVKNHNQYPIAGGTISTP